MLSLYMYLCVFLPVLFLSDSAVHVVRYACASLGELARSGPLPAAAVDVENVIGRLKEIIRETADVNVRWKNNHALNCTCTVWWVYFDA